MKNIMGLGQSKEQQRSMWLSYDQIGRARGMFFTSPLKGLNGDYHR